MRLARIVLAMAVGVGAVAACGDATGGGGGGGGHGNSISVENDFFNPTPDTAVAGQVTFNWGAGSNGHTVIWDSGPGTLPANQSTIKASGTYSVTLSNGTYTYHCSIHTGMAGTIVVQ